MHVNLGDYQYLLAGSDQDRFVQVVASRSGPTTFIHITRVRPPGELPEPERSTATITAATVQPQPGFHELRQTGQGILTDLVFGSGDARLEEREFQSLDALATWLRANPEARIALVGHSDAVGTLDSNTRLSRQRARAVLERLATEHGVDRSRMEAHGIGYLAPVASNRTPEGRARNRRVEVVRLDTK